MSIKIPQVSITAQRSVANFLDIETARIDAVIAKKCRVIVLIQKRGIARIYSAVRGASEDGRRKDSHLEWLGDVPESWPIVSVATQFEVLLGKMLNQDRVIGMHLKPYLRNTNIQWDSINIERLASDGIFRPTSRTASRFWLVICLSVKAGEPGRAAIWDGRLSEIYYQKALHRVRPRRIQPFALAVLLPQSGYGT